MTARTVVKQSSSRKWGSWVGSNLGSKLGSRADSAEDQDQFHWKPTLTLTFGLRYSLNSPPWETNGLQVSPTPNLGNLANARGQGMFNDASNLDPLVQFNLGGPANNGPGFYPWSNNFAPRFASAWTPSASGGWLKKLLGEPGQTVIRGGFGMVYDHIGLELMNTFDANGAFGLSTGQTNPAGVLPENAPRITSVNVIPTTTYDGTQMLFLPPPPGTFPQTPPYTTDTGGFAMNGPEHQEPVLLYVQLRLCPRPRAQLLPGSRVRWPLVAPAPDTVGANDAVEPVRHQDGHQLLYGCSGASEALQPECANLTRDERHAGADRCLLAEPGAGAAAGRLLLTVLQRRLDYRRLAGGIRCL